jgi:hypothetical protein
VLGSLSYWWQRFLSVWERFRPVQWLRTTETAVVTVVDISETVPQAADGASAGVPAFSGAECLVATRL